MDELFKSINSLPIDINRNLRLIKLLDNKFNLRVSKIENNLKEKNKSGINRNSKYNSEIDILIKESLCLSNQKINITEQAEKDIKEVLSNVNGKLEELQNKINKRNSLNNDNRYEWRNNFKRKLNSRSYYNLEEDDKEKYCFCNKAFNETMIECENKKCKIKWFHVNCVDFNQKIEDNVTWYCRDCLELKKYKK